MHQPNSFWAVIYQPVQAGQLKLPCNTSWRRDFYYRVFPVLFGETLVEGNGLGIFARPKECYSSFNHEIPLSDRFSILLSKHRFTRCHLLNLLRSSASG